MDSSGNTGLSVVKLFIMPGKTIRGWVLYTEEGNKKMYYTDTSMHGEPLLDEDQQKAKFFPKGSGNKKRVCINFLNRDMKTGARKTTTKFHTEPATRIHVFAI